MKDKIILIFLIIFFLVSLGAVSATDAVDDVLGDDAGDIYVSVGGNDSNAGTSSSPYATVGKAIEVSGNSSTIHLGEGTFTGENNSALTVNKQNMDYNGTITIVGAGIDKTIIDLNGAQFLNINYGTSIALVNLTIINGFANNGGAVYSQGNISIDSVKFVNNSASTRGGALYLYNYLTILNSIFENNYVIGTGFTRQGGSVYASGSGTYNIIDNNKFKNSYGVRGGALYANYANITNNEFENCTAIGSSGMGGAIYAQNVNFKNNTIFDCVAESGDGNKIYVSGSYYSGIIIVLDNSTVDILSTTFTLDATVTDDMGNSIDGPSISFYFNDTFIGYASSQDGIATGTFTKLLDNGKYIVTVKDSPAEIITGTAIYNIDRTFYEIYVSPIFGNDTSGNGSKENPYASIKKAISEGFIESNFVDVHLLEGTYTGIDNTQISLTNLGYLNIIGENDKVIIDGNNTATQAFNFGQNLNVELTNITFARFNARWGYLIQSSNNYQNPTKIIFNYCNFVENNMDWIFNIYNGELYNSKIINNTISIAGSYFNIIDNLTFINNNGKNGRFSINGEIKNSVFKNNSRSDTNIYYGLIMPSGVNPLISTNNTFEDNNCKAFSTGSSQSIISINDTFINNTDKVGGVASTEGNIEFNNAKFINNTATQNGGVVYHRGGNLTFTNCLFENNKGVDGGDIYGADPTGMTFKPLLDMENNLTFVSLNTTNSKFQLNANFELDNLKVGGYKVNFYLNGSLIGSAPLVNNIATLDIAGVSDGIYEISGTIDYVNKTTITNGILNISANPADAYDTYVSENGNDTNGNGSIDNPFATIKCAFDNAMKQNALSIVIHTIGTLKGEGNTLLDLEPDVNLTIVGVDKDTSIIDVETYNKLFYFKPTSDNVYVRLENITVINGVGSGSNGIIASYGTDLAVDNCIFENISGYALSILSSSYYVPAGSILINNTNFIADSGVFYSYQTAINVTILNTNVTDCVFTGNGLIYIKDAYTPTSSSPCFILSHFKMDNCIFDGNNRSASMNDPALVYLMVTDSKITNSVFINTKNTAAINTYSQTTNGGTKTPEILNSVFNIENCYFSNNTQDIYTTFGGGMQSERPLVNLINDTFENSGGLASYRYVTVVWNIENSSFINISNLQTIANEKGSNQNVSEIFGNITNSLFVNCNIKLDAINVTDSAFYNTVLDINRVRYNYYTPEADLNNNYWNNTTPVYTLSYSSGNVYCDAWILPALTTDNASGSVQTITLKYMLFDGENFIDYDVSNVPIFDEYVTVNVTDGTIEPTSGILTKDGLTFIYTYEGLGNQTITAVLDNNITAELNVTFYKFQTQLNLTINSDDLHIGDNLTVNIVLVDQNANLINGSVDIYLNSDLVDTIDVINGEGILSIVMDKAPRVYEVFANYTGSDNYFSSVNATTFTLSNTEMNVNVENNNSKDNVTFVISFNYPANGTVEVTIANETYTSPVEDGAAKVIVPPMDIGEYEALVSYNGIVNQTVPFNITKDTKTSIKAEDVEMYYEDGTLFNVTLTDAYGEALVNQSIILSVNGENFTETTNDEGIASFSIDLAAGNYTADVYYLGIEGQDSAETTVNINVLTNATTVISVDDLVMYYKDGSKLYINLTDAYGEALVNESVIINLNGANYTRVTNENGTASIAINLNSANYTVGIYYKGSETQDAANATALITILPTVNGTDVVKVFRNGTQYYATFLDNKGNYLAEGTNVTFNINGVTYTRQINGSQGRARLNINLAQGDYIITAINPVTGEMAANNITVIPRIVNNNDLVKYYRNDSQYYVQLIGDDGKPVGANETVTFNINGVMYERKTNASGIARLNINLQPGEYIITAMYKDCNVANNITVLPVLKAENVTMVYKDGTQFKASLVDGQGNPLANTNVTFNINGVFYQRTTDSNGVAALNINLMPGEYIITSSYNGTNIANTIKINDK